MPNQVTVTLPVGPGLSAVSQLIPNVAEVNFQLRSAAADKMVLQVKQETPNRMHEFDFDAAATVTYTISGQNSTVVVSS